MHQSKSTYFHTDSLYIRRRKAKLGEPVGECAVGRPREHKHRLIQGALTQPLARLGKDAAKNNKQGRASFPQSGPIKAERTLMELSAQTRASVAAIS